MHCIMSVSSVVAAQERTTQALCLMVNVCACKYDEQFPYFAAQDSTVAGATAASGLLETGMSTTACIAPWSERAQALLPPHARQWTIEQSAYKPHCPDRSWQCFPFKRVQLMSLRYTMKVARNIKNDWCFVSKASPSQI